MRFSLGLTGSIGMGKSTTGRMFVDLGCELWDADAAVHRLYGPGGAAAEPLKRAFPTAVRDGMVDRTELKRIIAETCGALDQIEAIVHPLVAQDRAAFRARATADILVFDIPLLFETGGDAAMDAVACVTAPPEIQRRRVLERGTMSHEQFELIKSKQMPDAEKRARSDFVIVTDSIDHAREQVQDIVNQIRARQADA